MSRFLSVVAVMKAREVIKEICSTLPTEEVSLHDTIGRILASDVQSDVDIPGFDRSTVDGYAVLALDTTGAGESLPSMLGLSGSIGMGEIPALEVRSGFCMYIPTGAFLPPGADAVVMIEHCEVLGDQVLVHRPVAPGENIVSRGEDFSQSLVAISAGTRITSRAAGVLAACGKRYVRVTVRPRVGIISTGTELVPVEETPSGGQIRDVNTSLCAGFVTEQGGIPVIFGIVHDDRLSLESMIETASATCDLVLISGGSSKGERDICADIIASRGEVLVHGVALSPGKPTIIGRIGSVPVIGLPGHPASAYVVLYALVRDLFNEMSGAAETMGSVWCRMKSAVSSARGREDYVRAVIDGDQVVPLFGKSGLTNTLLNSDGLIRIPAEVEGYEAGDLAEVILWR
ncbi:MAG TPA: gephyrin-like molybdotransferase Glp [Methanospirillum sp.]|nr:gephyrin-like molybdotransferase Glp [Methanospirillum sp.]